MTSQVVAALSGLATPRYQSVARPATKLLKAAQVPCRLLFLVAENGI